MPRIKNNTVYIVRAVRWNQADSYILGVYTKKQKAIKEALKEEDNRGGNKYKCHVYEYRLDKTTDYDEKEIEFDHIFPDNWWKDEWWTGKESQPSNNS